MTKPERIALSRLMIENDLNNFQELADVLGISRPSISQLWHGHYRYKALRKRISEHFKVPYKSIFTDE